MPLLGRIPLVPTTNTRGLMDALPSNGRDQRIIRGVPVIYSNALQQKMTVAVEKVPGYTVFASTPSNVGQSVFYSKTTLGVIYALEITPNTSTIFVGASAASGGVIDGYVYYYNDITIGGVNLVAITSNAGTGWFLVEGSTTLTTYTGDTHSNTTVDNVLPSTAGMYTGQSIVGSGIPVGARILTVNSSTTITLTLAATTSVSAVTLTKSPISKILDADFPSGIVGPILELNGYARVMTADKKIYDSDFNNLAGWTAANFLVVNQYSAGVGVGMVKVKNQIVALHTAGTEWFYYAGYPSGSTLGRTEQAVSQIGAWSQTKSLTQSNDRISFLGGMSGDRVGVYTFQGFEPVKVSDIVVDNVLKSFANNVRLYTIAFAGQDYLYLVRDSSFQFLYSFQTKMWSEAGWSQSFAFAEQASAAALYMVAHGTGTAKVYTTSDAISTVFTDDGSSYTMTIQVDDAGFGTPNRKTITGVSLIADNQASGTTTLKYSDDDGQNFTTHPNTFDMTVVDKRVTRASSYKGHRIWRIEHSANTPWRGQFLDIEGTVSEV